MSPSPPPLLAACCGPIVAVWDCSATSSGTDPDPIDIDTAPSSPASTDDGSVRIFRPHGPDPDAPAVSDLAWNHSGQILATCSSSPRPGGSGAADGDGGCGNDNDNNVVLTHAATGSALESFSNFHPPAKSSSSTPGASPGVDQAATSIGFGGKSRYICVSDEVGSVSIWDMKKRSRVRNYRLPQAGGGGATTTTQTCPAACIDPNDTLVAALSGCPTDGALRLYRLREGKLASTLRDGTSSRGGATALHFSPLVKEHCAVGSRDGSVLVWDVSVAASSASGKAAGGGGGGSSSSEPHSSLTDRHASAVTGVAFSPVNRLLLATSSLDGTMGFHDVNSRKTIQTIRAAGPEGGGATCVAFHSDGVTCAAGTGGGSALLYDLRKAGSGPLSTLTFERSGAGGAAALPPVGAVTFADRTSTTTSSSSAVTGGTLGKTPRAERVGTSGGADASSTVAAAAAAPSGDEKVSSARGVPAKEEKTGAARVSQEDKNNNDDDDDDDSAVDVSTEADVGTDAGMGLLSPMSHARRIIANSARKTALAASGGGGKGGIPLSTKGSVEEKEKQKEKEKSASSLPVPRLPPSFSSPLARAVPPPMDAEASNLTAKAESPPLVAAAAAASSSPSYTLSVPVQEAITPSESAADKEEGPTRTIAASSSLIAEAQTGAGMDAGAEAAEHDYVVVDDDADDSSPDVRVNKLVLQNMLDDAVDILRDDVEDAVRNLHVDMLRQFQSLSDEMRAATERQNEAMRQLVEENRSLREENDRLRGRGRI